MALASGGQQDVAGARQQAAGDRPRPLPPAVHYITGGSRVLHHRRRTCALQATDVCGDAGMSQKGELSIFAQTMQVLAPCLHMIPKLSLSDPETRCVCQPSPTLSPTDPVPRGLLTLCPGAPIPPAPPSSPSHIHIMYGGRAV